jgi:Glycosyl hydrolase family 99
MLTMKNMRTIFVLFARSACLAALVFVLLSGVGFSTARASGGRNTPVALHPVLLPPSMTINPNRPALAFYYPWYTTQTWSLHTMSDLPTIRYNSNDDATIDRQVNWAAQAGVTGFISSWWGQNGNTDTNFAKLLAHATTLQQNTGFHFASTIYYESDAPALQGFNNIVKQLRYVLTTYANSSYFFHWHGKPVIFFWDPLGGGRSLSMWQTVRNQVDPHNNTIWSAEGVNTNLLSVFDGIHLFSAAYWGIQHNNITAVDQGFRSAITAYNQAHHTQKIWAAGVFPGFNDTKVPGRKGTFIVPRNNGATYRMSWNGALASSPDWVTITSFNEWYEGAMIEPSISYNMQYLDLTHQFATQWHG